LKPKSDLSRLLELVDGYRSTCLLTTALESGLLDELRQGPRDLAQLAESRQWHPGALVRLAEGLNSLGLLEGPPEQTTLTRLGQQLLHDSLQAWLLLIREEYLPAWARLSSSLRTGKAAFPEVFGQTPWEHRQAQPHLQEAFEKVTAGQQRHLVSRILRHGGLPVKGCLADLGGGQGELLQGLLESLPQARGWLLDTRPGPVVPGRRFEVVVGSFFEPLPDADVYVLKHVLHNWPDQDCLRLLENCAAALRPGARLLIIEDLKGADWQRLQMDLHMLVLHGGQERSLSELTCLLQQARLRLIRQVSLGPGLPQLLEAML